MNHRYYAKVWGVIEPNQFSRRKPFVNWHFRVYDSSGRVIAMDNTGDWRKIYDNAHRLVRTFNECQTRGIKIEQPKWIKELGL